MPAVANNKMDTSASTLPLASSLMVYYAAVIYKVECSKCVTGQNETSQDLQGRHRTTPPTDARKLLKNSKHGASAYHWYQF
jgi:hypothetical protein